MWKALIKNVNKMRCCMVLSILILHTSYANYSQHFISGTIDNCLKTAINYKVTIVVDLCISEDEALFINNHVDDVIRRLNQTTNTVNVIR